jgi:hypothetical protein
MYEFYAKLAALEIDQILRNLRGQQLNGRHKEQIRGIISRYGRHLPDKNQKGRFALRLPEVLNARGPVDEVVLDQVMGEVDVLTPPVPPARIVQGLWQGNVAIQLGGGQTQYKQYYRASYRAEYAINQQGMFMVSYQTLAPDDDSEDVRNAQVDDILAQEPRNPVKLEMEWSLAVYVEYMRSNPPGTIGWVRINQGGQLMEAKGYICNTREQGGGVEASENVLFSTRDKNEPPGVCIYTTNATRDGCTVLCLYNQLPNGDIILSLDHIGGGNYEYVDINTLLKDMEPGNVRGVLGLAYKPTENMSDRLTVTGVLGLLAQAGVPLGNITVYQNYPGALNFGIDWHGNWGEVLDPP